MWLLPLCHHCWVSVFVLQKPRQSLCGISESRFLVFLSVILHTSATLTLLRINIPDDSSFRRMKFKVASFNERNGFRVFSQVVKFWLFQCQLIVSFTNNVIFIPNYIRITQYLFIFRAFEKICFFPPPPPQGTYMPVHVTILCLASQTAVATEPFTFAPSPGYPSPPHPPCHPPQLVILPPPPCSPG